MRIVFDVDKEYKEYSGFLLQEQPCQTHDQCIRLYSFLPEATSKEVASLVEAAGFNVGGGDDYSEAIFSSCKWGESVRLKLRKDAEDFVCTAIDKFNVVLNNRRAETLRELNERRGG